MSQGVFYKYDSVRDVEKKVHFMVDRMKEWDYSVPLCINFKPYRNARTLSQNALFHMWCGELSKEFEKRNIASYTPEVIKLYLKKQFLGFEDVKVGKEVIKDQLRHTSSLDKGEMVHFMEQCYHWAREQGVLLSVPQESEYAKYMNQ
tara:strand:- start:1669 stop:2109 length:441 start_codon:yes stop_codon:yes gene_type:complete